MDCFRYMLADFMLDVPHSPDKKRDIIKVKSSW